MAAQTIRNSFSTCLAVLLFTGLSCTTPKTETSPETQASEHGVHHPTDSGQQKVSQNSNMKNTEEMKAGEKMNSGMMMDKTSMKKMMDKCMMDQKDNTMCDHQMMDTCSKNMDSQACTKMMSDTKKEGNATKGKKSQ